MLVAISFMDVGMAAMASLFIRQEHSIMTFMGHSCKRQEEHANPTQWPILSYVTALPRQSSTS